MDSSPTAVMLWYETERRANERCFGSRVNMNKSIMLQLFLKV